MPSTLHTRTAPAKRKCACVGGWCRSRTIACMHIAIYVSFLCTYILPLWYILYVVVELIVVLYITAGLIVAPILVLILDHKQRWVSAVTCVFLVILSYQIAAASLEKLFQQLTNPLNTNREFLETFFMTYCLFTTAEDVLTALINCLLLQKDDVNRNRVSVRMCVCVECCPYGWPCASVCMLC